MNSTNEQAIPKKGTLDGEQTWLAWKPRITCDDIKYCKVGERSNRQPDYDADEKRLNTHFRTRTIYQSDGCENVNRRSSKGLVEGHKKAGRLEEVAQAMEWYRDFITLVIRDNVDPAEVYAAMMNIREFRRFMVPDIQGMQKEEV